MPPMIWWYPHHWVQIADEQGPTLVSPNGVSRSQSTFRSTTFGDSSDPCATRRIGHAFVALDAVIVLLMAQRNQGKEKGKESLLPSRNPWKRPW